MEPGKHIPLKTFGAGNTIQPKFTEDQETHFSQEVTAKGLKVSVLPEDQVKAYLPKERQAFSGIALQQRQVTDRPIKAGFFNRLISFIRGQPNAQQKAELWDTFQRLEKSFTMATGNTTQSIEKSHSGGITVNRESEGAKACALMVSSGLAKVVEQNDERNTLTIVFLRPDNLNQQTRGMEALAQCCPVFVCESGSLDWGKMVKVDQSLPLGRLKHTGVLSESGQPISDWFKSSKVIADLEDLATIRAPLEGKLAKFSPPKDSENQWDLARRRMNELADIAFHEGLLDLVNLLRGKTKTVSLMGTQQWQEMVDQVNSYHPLFANKLSEVTPNYSESFTMGHDVQYHQPPDHQQLKDFLKQHGLMQKAVTLKQVAEIQASQEQALFPIQAAFTKAVEKNIWSELKGAFVALDLPEGKPIDLERVQQGMTKLRRINPDLYARCLDDSQRAGAIADAEARLERFATTKKELAKEHNLDKDPDLIRLMARELVVPDEIIPGAEGDSAPPKSVDKEIMNPAKELKIVKAYDMIVNYLQASKSGKASMEDMQDQAITEALTNGVTLSMQNWQSGITKVPINASTPTPRG
ncbi:hypothetical protein [Parendozoicomonas sp. Alg238-R29]|uniref:hypothetical protein n=1 Tax=Parendozoicomonas sp. Alg238-R29 TaxID=2993446 RepID=UPI00248F41BD|nr:hypothetical protein [Parendozoicomonas sp. Alg238-R29]